MPSDMDMAVPIFNEFNDRGTACRKLRVFSRFT